MTLPAGSSPRRGRQDRRTSAPGSGTPLPSAGQGGATALPATIVAVELFPPLLVQAAWWTAPLTRAAPLAVALDGGRVLAVCPRAARAGCVAGQTTAQARVRCPALLIRPPEQETTAWLWEKALLALCAVSPVIEATDPQTGVIHLDARGLDYLWGDAAAVGRAALQALGERALAARAGGGPSRAVAVACAQRMGADGPTTLDGAQAQRFLAALPLEEPALRLPLRAAAALREVGITTAGTLAALPVAGLALRFGPDAVAAWRRAGGQEKGAGTAEPPLRPWRAGRTLAVEEHWEEGVADMLLVEAGCTRLCGRLAAALTGGGEGTAHLTLSLECDDGSRHVHAARCWPPLAPAAGLERTTQGLLAQCPLSAPVTRVALEARGLCARQDDQLGLWDGKAVTRRQERLAQALDAQARKHPAASFARLRRDPLSADGWRWESREREP